MLRCCANCFGDRGLRDEIIPFLSNFIGECTFCQSTDVDLVEPKLLGNYFELLVSTYVPDETGKSLIDLLIQDWNLFDHEKMDSVNSNLLVAEILDDNEIVQKNYSTRESETSSNLNNWGKLRDELMYQNRFFPKTEIDKIHFQNLLSNLLLSQDELEWFDLWYRARIQRAKDEVFQLADMGAPPSHLSPEGRANPAGIPYLYLASTPDTAVAEIRPHTGEYASVGHVNLELDLRVVDLRFPRRTVSPFLLDDETEIVVLRDGIQFLVGLGEELTRPVQPRGTSTKYIPSQYICEFIKNCGYHGVMYDSSVGQGVNLALFNPRNATIIEVHQYEVVRVSVEIDPNKLTVKNA